MLVTLKSLSKVGFVGLEDPDFRFTDIEEGKSEITVDYASNVVEQLIQYLYYKQRYDPEPETRPEFKIETYTALDLMTASYTLGC